MAIFSYYLAISLDGFLARKDGSVDWLDPYFTKLSSPYDYEEYYASVEGLVMGRKTYEACMSLGGGEYPYPDKPAWVLSKNKKFAPKVNEVTLLTDDVFQKLSDLRKETDGRLWLVGGGELASQLVEARLLDEIVLTIVPVILGSGLPWLGETSRDSSWQLVDSYKADNGLLQLGYRKSGLIDKSGKVKKKQFPSICRSNK